MKARRRRERAQGASAQGSNAEGSSVPLRGDRVWVDSWQLQCCGGSLVVGEATSLTVVDADVEHLRPLLGELAATVPYWEEHHADSRWMGQRGGRTLEGRVARIDVVRTKSRPVEPGATLHAYDPSTVRLEPTDEATGQEGGAGYLVELVPAEARVVWVYGDDHAFSLGDTITLPVTGPDPEQLEQLLGTELGAVTDQTFPWAEPLKLRKVTGRVARIEMFRYAHQCDGDGSDWELVDGSVGRSEVEGVPGPASRSGDAWRNQVGYLVTLFPDR